MWQLQHLEVDACACRGLLGRGSSLWLAVDFRNLIVFFEPRPWHIEIRHRVNKKYTINLFKFEILKLKIRRLKLWKPIVEQQQALLQHVCKVFGATARDSAHEMQWSWPLLGITDPAGRPRSNWAPGEEAALVGFHHDEAALEESKRKLAGRSHRADPSDRGGGENTEPWWKRTAAAKAEAKAEAKAKAAAAKSAGGAQPKAGASSPAVPSA